MLLGHGLDAFNPQKTFITRVMISFNRSSVPKLFLVTIAKKAHKLSAPTKNDKEPLSHNNHNRFDCRIRKNIWKSSVWYCYILNSHRTRPGLAQQNSACLFAVQKPIRGKIVFAKKAGHKKKALSPFSLFPRRLITSHQHTSYHLKHCRNIEIKIVTEVKPRV